MAVFVLVHGAWHGGWCWTKVRENLEGKGHHVFTPTIKGLGERQHLLSGNTSLQDVIDDLVDFIELQQLEEFVLVGHSFGGAVATGIAEKLKSKISNLIYLDAAILEDGESMFSNLPEDVVQERLQLSKETSNGLSLPTPSAENMGILDEKVWSQYSHLLTPHPLATYNTTISLNDKPGNGLSCAYVVCSDPCYAPLEWARTRAKAYGWPITLLKTGHDAMLTAPDELAELLVELGS